MYSRSISFSREIPRVSNFKVKIIKKLTFHTPNSKHQTQEWKLDSGFSKIWRIEKRISSRNRELALGWYCMINLPIRKSIHSQKTTTLTNITFFLCPGCASFLCVVQSEDRHIQDVSFVRHQHVTDIPVYSEPDL